MLSLLAPAAAGVAASGAVHAPLYWADFGLKRGIDLGFFTLRYYSLAYLAGIVAVVVGAALVFFEFPKHDREKELIQGYHEADAQRVAAARRT